MNRFQKRIITLAVIVGNLAFCLTSIAVATFAWFLGSTRVAAEGMQIQASEQEMAGSISYKILKYDNLTSSGKDYGSNTKHFYLPSYDSMYTENNTHANVVLRVEYTSAESVSAEKEIKIKIDRSGLSTFKNNEIVSNFTSNVIQFKSVISSVTDTSNVVHNLEPTILESGNDSSEIANNMYTTSSQYFDEKCLTPTTFIAIRGDSIFRSDDQTEMVLLPQTNVNYAIKKAVIYIECTYNKTLMNNYLGAGQTENQLEGDIRSITIGVNPTNSHGSKATGKYQKVTTDIETCDGRYLIGYENDSKILNGKLANSNVEVSNNEGINTNNNQVSATFNTTISSENPIKSIGASKPVDETSFEFSKNNRTFKSTNGYYIGNPTSSTNGIASNSSNANLENNISYVDQSDDTKAVIESSNGMYLQHYKQSTDDKFSYMSNSGSGKAYPDLYRYYENAKTYLILDHITTNASEITGQKLDYYVGGTFCADSLVVTAHYTNGETANVTKSCTFKHGSDIMNLEGTINEYHFSAASENFRVDIEYTENSSDVCTDSYNIRVLDRIVSSVEFNYSSYNPNFYIGEKFNSKNISAVATTNNHRRNTEDVTNDLKFFIGSVEVNKNTILSSPTFSSGSYSFTIQYGNTSFKATENSYLNIRAYILKITCDNVEHESAFETTVAVGSSFTLSIFTNWSVTWSLDTTLGGSITAPSNITYEKTDKSPSTFSSEIRGDIEGDCVLRAQHSNKETYIDITVHVVCNVPYVEVQSINELSNDDKVLIGTNLLNGYGIAYDSDDAYDDYTIDMAEKNPQYWQEFKVCEKNLNKFKLQLSNNKYIMAPSSDIYLGGELSLTSYSENACSFTINNNGYLEPDGCSFCFAGPWISFFKNEDAINYEYLHLYKTVDIISLEINGDGVTKFFEGDSFSLAGLTVNGIDSNNKKYDLTNYVTYSDEQLEPTTTNVEISYKNVSTIYNNFTVSSAPKFSLVNTNPQGSPSGYASSVTYLLPDSDSNSIEVTVTGAIMTGKKDGEFVFQMNSSKSAASMYNSDAYEKGISRVRLNWTDDHLMSCTPTIYFSNSAITPETDKSTLYSVQMDGNSVTEEKVLNSSESYKYFYLDLPTGSGEVIYLKSAEFYGDQTEDYNVTSLSLNGTAHKTDYIEGQTFDHDGIYVLGNTSNNERLDMTKKVSWDSLNKDLSYATCRYKNISALYNGINVSASNLSNHKHYNLVIDTNVITDKTKVSYFKFLKVTAEQIGGNGTYNLVISYQAIWKAGEYLQIQKPGDDQGTLFNMSKIYAFDSISFETTFLSPSNPVLYTGLYAFADEAYSQNAPFFRITSGSKAVYLESMTISFYSEELL